MKIKNVGESPFVAGPAGIQILPGQVADLPQENALSLLKTYPKHFKQMGEEPAAASEPVEADDGEEASEDEKASKKSKRKSA